MGQFLPAHGCVGPTPTHFTSTHNLLFYLLTVSPHRRLPGHLHIEGRKMSKSLKNFVTIQATLERYSARQMRLLFLLQHWAEPMELKPIVGADGEAAGFQQFEPAVSADKTFAEFFFAAQASDLSDFKCRSHGTSGQHPVANS